MRRSKFCTINILLVLIILLVLVYNVYGMTFEDYINESGSQEQSTILREEWHTTLGYDIFYPYFTVKLWEVRIRERFTFRMCGFVGSLTGDLWSDGFIYYKFSREM